MAKDRVQLLRLVFIDRKIREGMQSGKFANCTSIAAEYEVSPKTIMRDIDYLKNQRDAPLAYDPAKKGYFYTEENYSLPAISLNESDLFAICIAQNALKQHRNTPIYDKLAAVFRKIEDSLPDKVSIQPSWTSDRISVVEDRLTDIDPQVWECVAKGLEDNRQLEIKYRRPGSSQTLGRLVDPYHAVGYQGEWYLVGYCHLRREIRTFAVSRIRKARLPGSFFVMPADFSFQQYWGNRFGVFGSTEEISVVIRFSKEQAPYVQEREWHPTQKLTSQEDGGLVMSMTTTHLFDVKRWVLSWGRGVRVLQPPELVEAVRQELREILAGYN